ncbi:MULTISPECIES: hypothetical protein [Microbacterium]|uniref:hypothetical protein n=1 Tax=Microbacterium TaxID=33882 RepID=UPI001F3C32BB|nr:MULTISPECIES: hypothetical protein [Microbacterium]
MPLAAAEPLLELLLVPEQPARSIAPAPTTAAASRIEDFFIMCLSSLKQQNQRSGADRFSIFMTSSLEVNP